ncbi:MAG: D-aminoacyl-tRNA deacylase [Candidatus Limnocylindria bacterium]
MRAVIQRVRAAAVYVADERVSEIGHGLVVLAGIGGSDRPEDGERLAKKIAELRVFGDERGRMHRSVIDVGGAVLVVPQFTLYGDVRRGRRPDFTHAAPPERGRALIDALCGALRGAGASLEVGRFGANMRIEMEADGPVTIVATTDGWAEGQA